MFPLDEFLQEIEESDCWVMGFLIFTPLLYH